MARWLVGVLDPAPRNNARSYKARVEPLPKGWAYIPHSQCLGLPVTDIWQGTKHRSTQPVVVDEKLNHVVAIFHVDESWLARVRVVQFTLPTLEAALNAVQVTLLDPGSYTVSHSERRLVTHLAELFKPGKPREALDGPGLPDLPDRRKTALW